MAAIHRRRCFSTTQEGGMIAASGSLDRAHRVRTQILGKTMLAETTLRLLAIQSD
jgi:hypothetical protein